MPNKIPVVFQNGSNYDYYDYYFIVKEVANEFEGKFECIGETTKNCKTFSVLIEKKIRKVNKDGNKDIMTISAYLLLLLFLCRITT